jgi:hypothetical protein
MASSTSETRKAGGVFVRWRPLLAPELERGDEEVVRISNLNSTTNLASIQIPNRAPKVNSSFKFGNSKRPNLKKRGGWQGKGFGGVFETNEDNAYVYEEAIRPLVQETLTKGSIGCCFAYGMTGSGKTHTLLGYEEEKGMYFLAAQELFSALDEIRNETGIDFCVNLRFAELHNKRAYDLLNERNPVKLLESANGDMVLRQMERDEERDLWISKQIAGCICRTAEEIEEAINSGMQFRTSGNSSVHDQSSRSHAMIEMEIVTEEVMRLRDQEALYQAELTKIANDGTTFSQQDRKEKQIRESKEELKTAENSHELIGGTLIFCDLAGSEIGSDVICVGDEKISTGQEAKQTDQEKLESKQINISLMALAEVLKEQHRGTKKRVGYRNSPLTMYLRKFLKHNDTKCVMMTTISSSKAFQKRTVQTLRYANLLATKNQPTKKNKKKKKKGKKVAVVVVNSDNSSHSEETGSEEETSSENKVEVGTSVKTCGQETCDGNSLHTQTENNAAIIVS